jgi:hypothetical protein
VLKIRTSIKKKDKVWKLKMGSSGVTLDMVEDLVNKIIFKGGMGHARRGSCRGCCIDEIHALSSLITVEGA